MSNIQNLIVLDKTELEKRINELKAATFHVKAHEDTANGMIRMVEEIIRKSKPLEPIISDAFDAGVSIYFSFYEASNQESVSKKYKREYLTKDF